MTSIQHLQLDLLQTFVKIVDHGGDASAAAHALGITQPSISKRMSALRRIVGDEGGRPWLILKGKRWLLTAEGERVCGVVTDLVRRYEKVEQFIADVKTDKPTVSLACGQMAAGGFVRQAIEQLMKEDADTRVRLSTTRGRSRIEGVAGGQFDLGIVTDSEATIRDVARIELFIESLQVDRFVVVANPSAKAAWGKAWHSLPVRRALTANDLADLPIILPEPDASRRQQFDQWYCAAVGRMPNVVLEVGGWQTILQFVQAGLGVGFATEQAVATFAGISGKRKSHDPRAAFRFLDEEAFPPDAIRLIARKLQGRDTPDLTSAAQQLYLHLKQFSSSILNERKRE